MIILKQIFGSIFFFFLTFLIYKNDDCLFVLIYHYSRSLVHFKYCVLGELVLGLMWFLIFS